MKLLIVGLGSMGKRRARLLKGLGEGHKIFGVDNSPARCEEAVTLGITVYQSIPEAVEAEQYDGAFVCTAPLTHAILIDQLLDQGLPVFTELNLVSDGYEGLMEKAREKGLPLFLSSTMLYRGETGRIAAEVETFKATGKKVSYIYHIGQYLPDWHPWEHYKDFFVGDRRTGGVREILAVDLPWLVCAFGPVKDVMVRHDKLSSLEIDYDDTWQISLLHADGTMGLLAVDVVSPKAVRSFEAFGEGLHLFWEGNPQSLYRYNSRTKEKEVLETYAKVEQDPRYSDNIVENAYVDEILNFFQVLRGEAEPRWSFQKDLEVIRLMEAIECADGSCPSEAEEARQRAEAVAAIRKADDMAAPESMDRDGQGFPGGEEFGE